MKKLIFGFCIALLGLNVVAQDIDYVEVNQNGLVRMIIQKVDVPVAIATDATAYRVFVELEDDYEFLAIGGFADADAYLSISASTSFLNNTNFGDHLGTSVNPLLFSIAPDLEYDSYVTNGTIGGDDVYTLNNGLVSMDATSTPGGPFTVPVPFECLDGGTTNELVGSTDGWLVAGGVRGPASAVNQVYVAQFTVVDGGDLSFEFGMISLINPNGDRSDVFNSVAYSSVEVLNDCPTISLGSVSSSVSIFSSVTLTVLADDSDGSVLGVEFFVNSLSIGIDINDGDNSYSIDWTADVEGSYSIYAVATDDLGCSIQSGTSSLTVADDRDRPVVTIDSPADGSEINVNEVIVIAVTATDADGTIDQVVISANGAVLAILTSTPYNYDWIPSDDEEVILSVVATDNDGLSNIPLEVTIDVVDPSGAKYNVVDLSDPCYASDIFCVIIERDDRSGNELEDVIGFDIQMMYDSEMVTPTGIVSIMGELLGGDASVASYAMNIQGDSMINLAVYLNTTAPAGIGFNGVGDLLCIEFARSIDFDSGESTEFEVPLIVESLTSGVEFEDAGTGIYSIFSEDIFNGRLAFWADNSAIRYDVSDPALYLITNISGDAVSSVSVQPDMAGEFEYNISNGSIIQIDRDISGADVMSVLNSVDAYNIAKVLVNDASFNPKVEQMISMDVNRDQVVSAGDLSQINQRIVSIITDFIQVGSESVKDWLFIDPDTLLMNISYRSAKDFAGGFDKFNVPYPVQSFAVPVEGSSECPIIGEKTYKGVMLGDVNGSYKNIPVDGILKSAISEEGKILLEVLVGERKSLINVSLSNSVEAIGIDFRCDVANSIEFVSINKDASLFSAEAWIADDNKLRLTAMSLNNMTNNNNLVTIRLEGTDFCLADFDNMLAMINGVPVDYVVTLGSMPLTISYVDMDNVQIYPVPATDILNVLTYFNATIELYDIVGNRLKNVETVDGAARFNVGELTNGIYIVNVIHEDLVKTFKVVIE